MCDRARRARKQWKHHQKGAVADGTGADFYFFKVLLLSTPPPPMAQGLSIPHIHTVRKPTVQGEGAGCLVQQLPVEDVTRPKMTLALVTRMLLLSDTSNITGWSSWFIH